MMEQLRTRTGERHHSEDVAELEVGGAGCFLGEVPGPPRVFMILDIAELAITGRLPCRACRTAGAAGGVDCVRACCTVEV